MKKLLVFIGLLVAIVLARNVLPLGSPTPELASFNMTGIIDVHVHTAGIGAGNSGIFVSDDLVHSYKFPFYLRAFGVSESELNTHGDALVVERLSELVAKSRFIDRSVVLAMDGVIDKDGQLDLTRTQIFVPNEFVQQETSKYDNLMFGASVNPYRKDALERLEWAKANDAVLVKWIPSIMAIDPSDESIIPFYEKLVELDLPLLSHAGQERSFAHADDSLCDPLHLKLPLSLGVKVIAAHIATTGEVDGVDNFYRCMPLFKEYSNLYTDISSLTQINKLGYLKEALEMPEVVSQMIYGSDWPLQFFPLVSPWYHINHISFADAQYIDLEPNLFDRDVLLKKALGVPEVVFSRTSKILSVESK